MHQVTTLEEIERHYSLNDLLDANEALDIKGEADEYEHKKAQRDSERNRGK